MERVQDDLEVIAGLTVEVFSELAGEDAVRFAIVCEHAEVNIVRIVQYAHLGLFRGGLSFVGIVLHEAACHRRAGPVRFIE